MKYPDTRQSAANRGVIRPWLLLCALLMGVGMAMATPTPSVEEPATEAPAMNQVPAMGAGSPPPVEARPQPVAPPQPPAITAKDVPNDGGKNIIIEWEPQDLEENVVSTYRVERTKDGFKTFEDVESTVPPASGKFQDAKAEDGVGYQYRLVAVSPSGAETIGPPSARVEARAQWFNTTKIPLLIILLGFSGAILFNIWKATQGVDLYIRPIAGLEAMEEAVGRATEMGKPVLFVPGIQDMDDPQTIAGVSILGRLAKEVAEYDTELLVPTRTAVVMSACQNVVRESYYTAGRPDAYNPDNIFYLTDDQFGYAAGVDGLMVREKPAANFLLGRFFAESLILAETGNSVGAIQVAGTAESSQLPFFVTACDYTLLGEELFAASAYLTKEPMQLGSLKGQDWGKFFIMAVLIISVLIAQFVGVDAVRAFFSGQLFS